VDWSWLTKQITTAFQFIVFSKNELNIMLLFKKTAREKDKSTGYIRKKID